MKRIQEYFFNTAAIVLFLTGAMKLLGAAGAAPLLSRADALLPVSNRWVFVVAGVLELCLSAYLLMGRHTRTRLAVTVLLCNCLVAYRLALWQAGAPDLWDCLGNFNEWLTIPPVVLHGFMVGTLGFLCAGSYALLITGWLAERKATKAEVMAPATTQKA